MRARLLDKASIGLRATKAETLRVPLQASVPPAAFDTPGRYFLRDDMPLSRTPPLHRNTVECPCDLDLYTRRDPSSPWLYYGSGKTAEGYSTEIGRRPPPTGSRNMRNTPVK